MATRLLYFVDHPIQYQAPLLRLIARQPDIDLKVVFRSAAGSAEYYDEGFKQRVRWDISLLDGYDSEVLPDDREAHERLDGCDVAWFHGWQGKRMWALLAHANRLRKPVLMRGENTSAAMPDGGGLRGVAKRAYLDRIFTRCSAFLCIGSANRDYYLQRGIDAERLFSMPYAIDNELFSASTVGLEEQSKLRHDLGIPPKNPIILFAGKLQARKHPLTLVDAFQSLDREQCGNPFLVFVGGGEQSDAVEKAAKSDSHILFLGFRNQSELPKLYGLADIFVLASSREPWGLAVNEAMACQSAVVVSDQCGCAPDLVPDSVGRIVPAEDPLPLARTLANLLRDPDRLDRMGRAARAHIHGWNFEQDLVGLRQALIAVLQKPGTA